MTATAQKKQAFSDSKEEARFIADESGAVVYATAAFSSMASVDHDRIGGLSLSSLIEFVNPDEALRAQALFGRGVYIDAIEEGVHEVAFYAGSASRTAMRFDKVRSRNGRMYLIGSRERGMTDREFEEIVGQSASGAVAPDIAADHPVEFSHFLDMSNDMAAVSLCNGSFFRVNASFAETVGYKQDDLYRMSFIDLIHSEDRPQARNCLLSLMREEEDASLTVDFEARLVTAGGRSLSVEWRQKRIGDLLYTVGRDITAIKESESALRRQRQQLEEAQAIGHMGHWRWTVGSDDLVWSDEIFRIFGVGRDAFRPTLETINSMLHKRDMGRLLQAFQRAIIEQNNYDMDFRIIRPDGEVRYIRCEGRCENDGNGEVIALFGIMQDVTDHTLHERDLKEAKDAAERAYAAKSQFLANMSHELRTPLNAIIGFSEMMQRQLLGPIGTEKYLDYITGIRESGEHLLDLISDILDMSKIEAGKYELDLEELNVAKVVRIAIHMMEGRAQEARIGVSADIADENLHIVADRRAVMQILLNLLSNAVKFTKPGGSIVVSCEAAQGGVMLRVKDTGVGIPAHKIKFVTRPFEQASSHYARDHQGTGLGLAITKELAELHGGSLQIESVVGEGTTVNIRLPFDAYECGKKKKPSRAAS